MWEAMMDMRMESRSAPAMAETAGLVASLPVQLVPFQTSLNGTSNSARHRLRRPWLPRPACHRMSPHNPSILTCL